MRKVAVFLLVFGLHCFAGPDYLLKRTNRDVEIRRPGYFAILVGNPPAAPKERAGADLAAASFRQKRIHLANRIDDLLVVDLNKDGLSDLAILDDSSKQVLTWMGDGTGAFAKRYQRTFSEMGALFAGAADFTEDKKLDLAVVNNSNLGVKHFSIFPGDGTGRLNKPKTIVFNDPSRYTFNYAQTLDFNGDGKPDLLGLKYDGTLIACRNIGKAKFIVTKINNYEGNLSLAVGDFDGDKKDDFFVHKAYPHPHEITFYKSLGDGTFTVKRTIQVQSLEEDLYASDLNGDRKLDLIGSGNFVERPWTMFGQGTGNMVKKRSLPGLSTLQRGACVTDINGDKAVDIVSAEKSGLFYCPAKSKGVYENYYVLGESFCFDRLGSRGTRNVGVGNFNGDQKPDIVGAQYFGESYKPSTNLLFFLNGETPASLQISNVRISYAHFDGEYVYVTGGLDYSGSDIDLHYDPSGTSPTDSAFMQLQIEVVLSFGYHFHLTALVTGDFLNMPGADSGTIGFDLKLPSSVHVYGTYTATTTVKNVYLMDYNLIKSQEITL